MESYNSKEIRKMLLGSKDEDTELTKQQINDDTPCVQLHWSKDHWVVRVNNKKICKITQDDVSEGVDLRDNDFVINALGALKAAVRAGEMEALKSFLEGA